MRRKRLSCVVALALCAVIVVAASGCGGDTAKAKQDMQQGDKMVQNLDAKGKELSKSINDFFGKLAQDVSTGKTIDPNTFAQETKKLQGELTAYTKEANKAKAEYKKIKGLKGVPDYVAYADLMISVINRSNKEIDALVSFLGKTSQSVTAGTFDAAQFSTEVSNLNADVQKQGQTVNAELKKAQDLKTKKKL